MFYKIDNYGNKVELPYVVLVSDYTPAQLVDAGYDLWDLGEAFVAIGADPDVFSDNFMVREEAAKSGKCLDVLIHDKDSIVRKIVAEQGFGLDVLIHDKHRYVRRAVAKQGYGLDILINDDDEYVRLAVVRQGYGLDVLIHDKHEYVRKIAKEKLAELKS